MGWANCGTDSTGRPIGYAFTATCDAVFCEERIDRGLAFKCGPMHGSGEYHCEGYFCPEHLFIVELPDGTTSSVCPSCLAVLEIDDDLRVELEPRKYPGAPA